MSQLHIIAGNLRGKKLILPPETITRPTSNRTREAVFNCLFSMDIRLNGAIVLDGFAGSGAMGIEALSRGASFCSFVENNSTVLKILQKNLETCALSSKVFEVKRDFKALSRAYDIVYLDPPYGGMIDGKPAYIHVLEELTQKTLIAPHAIIMIETSAKEIVSLPAVFTCIQEKTYGAAKVGFYQLAL